MATKEPFVFIVVKKEKKSGFASKLAGKLEREEFGIRDLWNNGVNMLAELSRKFY